MRGYADGARSGDPAVLCGRVPAPWSWHRPAGRSGVPPVRETSRTQACAGEGAAGLMRVLGRGSLSALRQRPASGYSLVVLPATVRPLAGAWVTSIRRACAFGAAGMVTRRTPSA
jgi:hypothetical protein